MTTTFFALHFIRYMFLIALAALLWGKIARTRHIWVLAFVWGFIWTPTVAFVTARSFISSTHLHTTIVPVLVEPFLVVGLFALPLWIGLVHSSALRQWLTPSRAAGLGLVVGGTVDLLEGLIDLSRGGPIMLTARISPLVHHPLAYVILGIRSWDTTGAVYSAYAMAYGIGLVFAISSWLARHNAPRWTLPMSLLIDAWPHALTNKALSSCLFGLCVGDPFPTQPLMRFLWKLSLKAGLPTLGMGILLFLIVGRRLLSDIPGRATDHP